MRKSAVRLKCFAVLATTAAVFGLGVQAASASVPSKQRAEWISVDGTFGKADLHVDLRPFHHEQQNACIEAVQSVPRVRASS